MKTLAVSILSLATILASTSAYADYEYDASVCNIDYRNATSSQKFLESAAAMTVEIVEKLKSYPTNSIGKSIAADVQLQNLIDVKPHQSSISPMTTLNDETIFVVQFAQNGEYQDRASLFLQCNTKLQKLQILRYELIRNQASFDIDVRYDIRGDMKIGSVARSGSLKK